MEIREDSPEETPPLYPLSIGFISQPIPIISMISLRPHTLLRKFKTQEENSISYVLKNPKACVCYVLFSACDTRGENVLFNVNLVLSNSPYPYHIFLIIFFSIKKLSLIDILNWTFKEYSLMFWPVKSLPQSR